MKKPAHNSLALLLGFGLALAGCFAIQCGKDEPTSASPNVQGQANQPVLPTIVFLGDSLTAGRGLPLDQAMPAQIQAKVQSEGWRLRVVNAGRSGDTTAGGLARLDYYLQERNKVRVLVIGLGSNDAMRGQPIANMKKNLTAIVTKTRAFDPTIRIFLFQMYAFPNLGRQYGSSFSKLFGDVARAQNIVLLPFPLLGVAGQPNLNQNDGIHPNEAGTRIFTENVWKALRPHLAKLPATTKTSAAQPSAPKRARG